MSITIPVIDRVLELGSEILKRAIPDPAQRAAAELELYRARQAGELDVVRVQLSAILAEAQSADPWTSRARPSFMYVMYVMILASIPVGIAQVFNPAAVAAFTVGVTAWLNAIPEELWWLFGAGYLGYTGARSLEKRKGAAR
ncbi:Holin of 3TMs, for gene-transfer release [Aromatoleum tolulyticum]|uniref:Holin of 3TMs, for gene-transfer release n=1 Tax=Aromatoleum tolulyticum TaxID=34027 RepID=A0A1N6X0U2_9RHOO|nr:holin family protein [Aromatoleum tolulyticum]SIQ95885.1 Holin of 3TMs, for gene-transfer release [Aromatoleum tolulyticum]